MASITCPSCNASLPDDAKFCLQCGTPVPVAPLEPPKAEKPTNCIKCGAALPEDAKFCLQCGTAVAQSVPTEPDEKEKLYKEAEQYEGKVLEFDDLYTRAFLVKRARRWTLYEVKVLDEPTWAVVLYKELLTVYVLLAWYDEEWALRELMIKIDNPQAYETYFKYMALLTLMNEADERKYIIWNLTGVGSNMYVLAPHMVKHLITKGNDLKEDDVIPILDMPPNPMEIDSHHFPKSSLLELRLQAQL